MSARAASRSNNGPSPSEWVVYIARSASGYLYTGISTDVVRRIGQHNAGTGAKFARMHPCLELVYRSEAVSHSEALKREYAIKRWSRAEKLRLVEG